MKRLFAFAILPLLAVAALGGGEAAAKGCIKGAVIGGIAGHVAGHGLAGAAAGCVIGRHNANEKARQRDTRGQQAPDQQRPASAY